MGVAVSDWRLANAVARTGQLGVVSGTALEVMCVRRLQDGDPGGHVRRALARFPIPRIAAQIVETYHLEHGRAAGVAYRHIPMFSARPAQRLQELAVAAGFVEVHLAEEGHEGPVGINLLRKIEAPIPFVLYGALLAGVDAVLVGAGSPTSCGGSSMASRPVPTSPGGCGCSTPPTATTRSPSAPPRCSGTRRRSCRGRCSWPSWPPTTSPRAWRPR